LWDSRFGVLKLEECLRDISRHAEIKGVSGVIPVDVDATEERTVPIHGKFVVFLETFFEMRDMVARGGFDAKVVDNEAEGDVTPHMSPETGGV
jgi:hypothetical protein